MTKLLFTLLIGALFSGCGGGGYGNSAGGMSIAPGTSIFTVTSANAPNAYTINGLDNPSITLQRGQTYTFNISAAGHPFYIMQTQGTNIANAYTFGVSGNGSQTGTVSFTVPSGAPNFLYYDCSVHSAMTGTINITN